MSDAWPDLFRAAIAAGDQPIILALATVGLDGRPQVRSVVCRRFDRAGLWFTSDARSAKNAELAARPDAAASCWLPARSEQFRFSGPVERCDNQPDRLKIWSDLKPETRATFFWPAPGMLKDESASAFPRASDALVPPDSFSVLVLRPTSIELLELTSHPHRRRRWLGGPAGWRCDELNP